MGQLGQNERDVPDFWQNYILYFISRDHGPDHSEKEKLIPVIFFSRVNFLMKEKFSIQNVQQTSYYL